MSLDFETIWARLTRVISFFLGAGIMVFETVADNSDRPWLYAAALGMIGLPVARAAENVLSHFGGTGPQTIPHKGEPETAVSETQTGPGEVQ